MALALIQAQNDTIAKLNGEFDSLRAHGSVHLRRARSYPRLPRQWQRSPTTPKWMPESMGLPGSL
eukprot:3764159-Pyramimonas_sp.AAC.1